MSQNKSGIKQLAKAGRDAKQVAGDNKETIISTKLFIGIFFLAVIALGGLAWAFAIGWNQNKQAPQIEEKTSLLYFYKR